ncbi:transposase [Mycoplasmopsis bovigenitalium]|uniref:transposase n=1 Tax=Mycoplasmopsis bovigenitalium TaxID=2112 RepID=UPI0003A6FC77|nr:transposase [Mycoplasmopsis bovigenitalium]
MSRRFIKDEFDMIYKIYNEFGLKQTINYVNEISLDTNFITRSHLVRRIKKIIRYYNNGTQEQLLNKKGANRKPRGAADLKNKLNPIETNLQKKN